MLVFCDYLSIYQVHFKTLPVVNEGRVFKVDADGQVVWDVGSKVKHKGSFETSLLISCDGNRVTLSGNVGRFNRQDNVFGYSVADCIRIANRILAEYDLPPFYDAKPLELVGKRRGWSAGGVGFERGGKFGHPMNADHKDYYSQTTDAGFLQVGAVITRVDLTCNYCTGSPGNASQFLRHLQGFKSGKFEPKAYFNTGVSWGEGSKYWYAKVYDKAVDYLRHHGEDSQLHNAELYAWLKSQGVVRHEITLKSRYLLQNNLSRMIQWGYEMKTEQKVYALFTDAMTSSARVDEYLEIPGRAGELAVAWRDGADLRKRLSRPTFYRYRKELLKYGIDVALQANVARLRVHVEIITVLPAVAPDHYVLPRVA